MANQEIFGIMRDHPEQIEVPITPRNSQFFRGTLSDDRLVMVHHGAGLVDGILKSMEDCSRAMGIEVVCSFFDNDGQFYDNAKFEQSKDAASGRNRHIGSFEVDGALVELSTDSIYCIGSTAVEADTALLGTAQSTPAKDRGALA